MKKILLASLRKASGNAKCSLLTVPCGIVESLILMRDRLCHHVAICNHIGDFIITMGYLSAYREKYDCPINVYLDKKFLPLLSLYPQCFDKAIVLPQSKLERILSIGRTNFGQAFLNKVDNLRLINPADAFTSDYFQYPVRFPNLTLLDCIKYGNLALSKESDFTPPRIPSPVDSHSQRVLVCPYASVTEAIPYDFLVRIVQYCTLQGYEVFTNASVDQMTLPGTKAIHLPLEEIVTWVNENTYVIGARSGIMDLLAYTPATVIALYPPQDIYQNFFDIHMLPETVGRLYQFTVSEATFDEIIRIIN